MSTGATRLHENDNGRHFGFWTDLNAQKFEEVDGQPTQRWIQAMKPGNYSHPEYGMVSITEDRIMRFAANVNHRVRGIDLDIDYDHKELTTEAAGWVQKAEARGADGLWLLVEWTKDAFEKIKTKAFRYFSPEFVDEWTHPQTGMKHKDVLFGGGITNRPYLKNLLPINLSEITRTEDTGGKMNRAQLELMARALGVAFDDSTTDEQLTTAVTEKAAVTEPPTTEPPSGEPDPNDPGEGGDGDGDGGDGGESGDGDVEETDPELVALSEKSPAIKRMLAERKADRKRIQALEASNTLSEVRRRTASLNTPDRQLSPAASTQLNEFAVRLPVQAHDKLYELVKTLTSDHGVVQLGERGRTGEPVGDAGADFDKAVEAYMSKHSDVSFADACEAVSRDNPQLFSEYRESSYGWKE